MKRFLVPFVVVGLSAGLVACGGDSNIETDDGRTVYGGAEYGGGATGGQDNTTGLGADSRWGQDGTNSAGQNQGQSAYQGGSASYNVTDIDNPQSDLAERIVYFAYDSSDIQTEYASVLHAHGRYLTQFPRASIVLEGHGDERGSREYNIALGQRRADAVKRLLQLRGVSSGQIRTISYGEEKPAAIGHSEGSWAANRRVEIVYNR